MKQKTKLLIVGGGGKRRSEITLQILEMNDKENL